MKKKYSVKGTYSVNGGEDKEFEIEYNNLPGNEEDNNRLLQLLDRPWRLIKEGGKHGVNGVKRFFTVLFLFAITNTLLFFYAISRLFSTEFEFGKILFVFLVLILGLAVTIYATYRTYQYVVIDTIRVIYENLSSFFQKISELIIEKVSSASNGKVDLNDKELTKALDFGKMVNSKFRKAPKFLRKGIILILSKIPFVSMLTDLHEEIAQGNKADTSAKLYNKMDNFISGTIFGSNNTRWVLWLLPINIIVLLIIIKSKIG